MSERPTGWERLQLLKHNSVRIPFNQLAPAIQHEIGDKIYPQDLVKIVSFAHDTNLRVMRFSRAWFDGLSLLNIHGIASAAHNKQFPPLTTLALSLTGTARTIAAKLIQSKYVEIANTMKTHGILQPSFEKEYPPKWLNPTVVAETHPIFSVQANGDVVFRRVTPKEFKLLKMQDRWIGKAGLNVWRWRGTLRKPQAPETEQNRFTERLRAIAERVRRIRLPGRKPVPQYARARLPGKPMLRRR